MCLLARVRRRCVQTRGGLLLVVHGVEGMIGHQLGGPPRTVVYGLEHHEAPHELLEAHVQRRPFSTIPSMRNGKCSTGELGGMVFVVVHRSGRIQDVS